MTNNHLRLRVFAGPNGSGKSTIINSVRSHKENGKSVDFGIYINADDIARSLTHDLLEFKIYKILTNRKEFITIANESGLVGERFPEIDFLKSFSFVKNTLRLKKKKFLDHLAQVIAHFLREKLLLAKEKFSFETVFSHVSKVEFMEKAHNLGYKVYLYFVSTESADINVYRVKEIRVKNGGHDVAEHLIKSRYDRSLELLYRASQTCYSCYYFDNSIHGQQHFMIANFKLDGEGKKNWQGIAVDDINRAPNWFKKYYLLKQPE